MNQSENGLQNKKAAFQQLLPLAQCSSKERGITSKAEEEQGATGQGWLGRNADEESAPSSYLSRVMSGFNQHFACLCEIYPQKERIYEKTPPLVCGAVPATPQRTDGFCVTGSAKGIAPRTISTPLVMNYKPQTCNSRGSQESNVLLVGIFSLLMRFFFNFKGRPTYSNFEKWRLEIRSLGGIYRSGMPLGDVCEEAGLNSEREECYF